MVLRETQLLEKLVACNTVNPPGNERALAVQIAAWAHGLGLSAELQELSEGRANLLVHIGKPGGKRLIFNGHLDTVPASDQWHTNPFQLSPTGDGWLAGLGSSDMKGGVACMMTAAEQLLQEGFPFQGELLLCFVADEECDDLGTRRFLRDMPKADGCVIGEPTDLHVCVAHRGVCRHRVTIEGRSCHASNPDDGVNAVEKMALFACEIPPLHCRLQQERHPILPPASVAVTTFHGGDKHNIIPQWCEAVLDWRTLPGQTEPVVRAELTSLLSRLSHNEQDFQYSLTEIVSVAAGELPVEHPFVKQCLTAAQGALNSPAFPQAFPACGEQALFLKAGIPTIFFGPGAIKQAHTVDESIQEQQLPLATAFYHALVQEMLG